MEAAVQTIVHRLARLIRLHELQAPAESIKEASAQLQEARAAGGEAAWRAAQPHVSRVVRTQRLVHSAVNDFVVRCADCVHCAAGALDPDAGMAEGAPDAPWCHKFKVGDTPPLIEAGICPEYRLRN
ncbi:MAG TPA: hypothetical protein VGQ83_39305 [Polyangia bacterium]|jgi:hypothetical protein